MKIDTFLKTNEFVLAVHNMDGVDIRSITYDSRRVVPDTLFVAIAGFSCDGHDYISDARAKGAVAVLSERSCPEGCTHGWVTVTDVRAAMADVAKKLWSIDFSSMKSFAVTGTNGKTTIATVLRALCVSHFSQSTVWQIGTLGNWYGERYVDTGRTTPEFVDLAREIGTADPAPEALVMEVSSHALSLQRVRGILFDIALFTNLTQDHLDFHDSMESYFQAKKTLFTHHLKSDGYALINRDDPYGKRLAKELSGAVYTYGCTAEVDFSITEKHSSWDGVFFRLSFRGETIPFSSPLTGDFTVYNLTAAAGAFLLQGYSSALIQRVFDQLEPVPGRMEKVTLEAASFQVVVDYAHTPDALENVLTTVRKLTKGRLILVFGAGGDRDRGKRPRMGAVAARYSDYTIITSDNPRTEDPAGILRDIADGVPADAPFKMIEDRRIALETALDKAGDEDVVLVAGKGHETYQEIGTKKYHFDDREEVSRAWQRLEARR
ncbi:UDP-N-acetylmuramoyl-L-alanyl-D-glutamate--2,6-diaminopimelate ligase [Chitinivibrio alkaliphilus]|nr:UDP-N-acetylmuramoyl-L-alanyl-D-glutamate--2,6-diaminopimelate ligase [Chitinivibrio alkaliphilus]